MSLTWKSVIRIIGFFLGALLTEGYAIALCFLFGLAAATASIIQAIEEL